MTRIFISYRRGEYRDGEYHELPLDSVGRLRDRLVHAYGDDAVFRDSDDIGAGDLFNPEIRENLANCRALLVVIGPRWLDARGFDGGRRLDSPDDWVRTEVELGLARPGLLVVPVLVDGAALPTTGQLPDSMRGLLDHNGVKLRDETYDSDFEKLARAIGGRRGLLRFAPVVGAAAVVLALVAGLLVWQHGGGSDEVAGVPTTSPSSPAPTTTTPRRSMPFSTFNIAVAEFTSSDPADAGAARALAEEFSRTLPRTLPGGEAPQGVTVFGPDEIGVLRGATEAERAAAARDLATRINASVVIGGRVEFAGSSNVVNPEATLNPRKFPASPELSGSWPLGPLSFPGNLTSPEVGTELLDGLRTTTGGVAQFIGGLGWYERLDGDPESALPDAAIRPGSAEQNRARARSAFEAALATHALPPTVQAAAHTFLGSLALLGTDVDLAGAQQEFDQALRLDPTSARAQLGSAEVVLQRSSGDGCAAVDGAGLEAAATSFEAVARRETDRAATAVKARLGRARALRCLSQAGLGDHFDEAETLLKEVIAEADAAGQPDGDVDPLREWAAAAHAELALTIAPDAGAGPTPDRDRLVAALAETRDAVERTHRDRNKAVFLWQEAFYLGQLGRTDEAASALTAAAGLDPRYASATVAGLGHPPTGRLVPWNGGSASLLSGYALAATGHELVGLVGLALGLLGIGLALVRTARYQRARPV